MAASGASFLWFLFVLALIPASLWLLKRSGLAHGLGGGLNGSAPAAPMKVMGQLNLGPAQRLVTVEVGQGDERTWLVLGVTGQGIQTLHTMAPQVQAEGIAAGGAVHPAFATLLRRTRQGGQ